MFELQHYYISMLQNGDGCSLVSLAMQYIYIFLLLCGIVSWCFISTTLVTAFVPHHEHNNFAKNPNQQAVVCKAVLFATTTDDIVIEGSEEAQDDR